MTETERRAQAGEVPCDGCGRFVAWTRTVHGKRMPLDPEGVMCVPFKKGDAMPDSPEPLKTLMLVDEEGRTFKARTCASNEKALAVGRVSHFATCPEAQKFRGTR